MYAIRWRNVAILTIIDSHVTYGSISGRLVDVYRSDLSSLVSRRRRIWSLNELRLDHLAIDNAHSRTDQDCIAMQRIPISVTYQNILP